MVKISFNLEASNELLKSFNDKNISVEVKTSKNGNIILAPLMMLDDRPTKVFANLQKNVVSYVKERLKMVDKELMNAPLFFTIRRNGEVIYQFTLDIKSFERGLKERIKHNYTFMYNEALVENNVTYIDITEDQREAYENEIKNGIDTIEMIDVLDFVANCGINKAMYNNLTYTQFQNRVEHKPTNKKK